MAPVLPKNGRAAFGADHGIVSVLHDEDAIRHTDPERATRTALTDDHGNDGGFEQHHFTQIHRDGFRDVPLLRADSRKSPGRVDQRDDRELELRREAHDAQCLAVSLGMSAAEVAQNIFLCVAAFLIGHHSNRASADFGQTARHGCIIAE